MKAIKDMIIEETITCFLFIGSLHYLIAEAGGGGLLGGLSELLFGSTGPRGGRHPGLAEQAARSAVRTVGSSIGREIVRGVLGSLLGGSKRR